MTDLEIGKELVSTAAEELPGIFQTVAGYVGDLVRRYDLANCAQRYRKALVQDYGQMQILGMEQPIPLQSIYTEVRIANRVSSRSFQAVDDLLEEAKKQVEERSLKSIKQKVHARILIELRSQELNTVTDTINQQFEPEIQMLEAQLEEQRTVLQSYVRDRINEHHSRSHASIRSRDRASEQLKLLKKELQKKIKKRGAAIKEEKQKILEYPIKPEEKAALNSQFPILVDQAIEELTRKQLHKLVSKAFSQDLKHTGSEENAWNAVIRRARVLILGRPGAGKTTFLKHLLLKTLLNSDSEERLPIFISLRNFSDSESCDLFQNIVEEFDSCGFPKAEQFVERVLKKSDTCLLLLDGLDEVSADVRDKVVEQINRLSRKYRGTQFVVSCRTANYLGRLQGFSELEIIDFSREQIARFVKNWFQTNEPAAIRFLKELRNQQNLEELTTTPLLLAILCIAYKRNQQFPEQRASLYLMCIDALLVDWDSSRQIRREVYVEQFDVETKKQLLAKVACDTFCENQLFLEKEVLISNINRIASYFGIKENAGTNVVLEFTRNHGLLVERAKNIFSFSHLTFHEFFTALHLSKNSNEQVIDRLFDELWQDARWKETITFLGGLAPSADSLIVTFVQKSKKKVLASTNIHELLDYELPSCVESILQDRKISGNHSVWKIWFRVQMLDYLLHLGAYSSITDVPRIYNILSALIRLGMLSRGKRHELAHDRPLNRTLAMAIRQLPENLLQIAGNADVQSLMLQHLRISEVVLDILANRSRVSKEIQFWAISELFCTSSQQPPLPPSQRFNRLGV